MVTDNIPVTHLEVYDLMNYIESQGSHETVVYSRECECHDDVCCGAEIHLQLKTSSCTAYNYTTDSYRAIVYAVVNNLYSLQVELYKL